MNAAFIKKLLWVGSGEWAFLDFDELRQKGKRYSHNQIRPLNKRLDGGQRFLLCRGPKLAATDGTVSRMDTVEGR